MERDRVVSDEPLAAQRRDFSGEVIENSKQHYQKRVQALSPGSVKQKQDLYAEPVWSKPPHRA
jgi:hypothetical protein